MIRESLMSWLLLSLFTSIGAQKLDWTFQTGGTEFDLIMDVATDSKGNIYSTGNFVGKVIFGNQELEYEDFDMRGKAFLQKVNSNGTLDQVFITEGNGFSQGLNIVIDAKDNLYLTGVYSGEMDFNPAPDESFVLSTNSNYGLFLVKLSSEMDFIWAVSIGENSGYIEADITLDAQQNIYLGGVFNATVDVDPTEDQFELVPVGSSDIFMMKLGPEGDLIWAKSMGSNRNDALLELTYDSATKSLISTGYFREHIGKSSFEEEIGISSNGSWDVFIQKTNLSGEVIWTKAFGGPDWDTGYSLTTDDNGNIYTAGTFFSVADFDPGPEIFELIPLHDDPSGFSVNDDGFVHKMDSTGGFVWARAIRSKGSSIINDIAVNQQQDILVTGNFTGELEFTKINNDLPLTILANETPFFTSFTGKFSPDGIPLEAFPLGGCNTAIEQRISIDPKGAIILAGIFDERVDFDPTSDQKRLTSRGSFDGYTLKIEDQVTSLQPKFFQESIDIHPNPASNLLFINGSKVNQNPSVIKVFNNIGAKVLVDKNVGLHFSLEVANFPPGLYTMVIENENRFYTTKWIKN